MSVNVIAKVLSLPSLSRNELKKLWTELFDSEPQREKNDYLIPRLAWRIQELAHDGLDENTKNTINENISKNKTTPANTIKSGKNHLLIGTTLIRKYKGTDYYVTVTRNGFEFQGKTYKSLSAIANKITNIQWSGPLFFGLNNNKMR